MLGVPIKNDKFTKDRIMLRYARLVIDIELNEDFQEYIDFASEHKVLIRQPVIYEWKAIQCKHYKMYGHLKEDCRKKKPIRQE